MKSYEAGSKSAKTLAYRLKKQQAERVIYKMRTPYTKELAYRVNEIRELFAKYYQKLYALRPSSDCTILAAILAPQQVLRNRRQMPEITGKAVLVHARDNHAV